MRLLLDANVIVSATISVRSAPRTLIEAWLEGRVELVTCPQLLEEIARALRSPKLASRISPEDATAVVALLRDHTDLVSDPEEEPPVRSPDPADDDLLALAARELVPLVTGDAHVLGFGSGIPVFAPRDALGLLEENL